MNSRWREKLLRSERVPAVSYTHLDVYKRQVISSSMMIDASSSNGKVVRREYKTTYWKKRRRKVFSHLRIVSSSYCPAKAIFARRRAFLGDSPRRTM